MSSYKNILKSTGLIAVVQIVQLFFGLIRNKVIALALGTNGFGIWGLYQTYIEMLSSFSTLGIDQSGVREIAKKSSNSDNLGKSIFILRRTLLVISLFMSLISVVFSKSISISLFGTEKHYYGVIIVSCVILLNGITKGQTSILNGLQDLRGLAISQILGSAIGSIITVSLVFVLGLKGIPVYLLIIALTASISTWWMLRKLSIPIVIPKRAEAKTEIWNLLSLGFGFSITALIASLMTYFSRIYIGSVFDLSVLGIYQASWTISNLYIGIILSAMGVDFMPRLMKIIDNKEKLTVLINEQMELGILISSIGIVTVLLFSSYILELLYSSEFIIGSKIIRWQILGVALRVLGFPLGYSIMAYNKPRLYIIIQAIFWISDYLLLVFFTNQYGTDGLGINYLLSYILYVVLTWLACRKLFNFKSSLLLRKIIFISFSFIISAWLISYKISGINLWMSGILLILIMTFWVNNYLSNHMNFSMWKIIQRKLGGLSK